MLHGQVRYNLPSRFLDELPKQSIKMLTPKQRDSAWSSHSRQVSPSWGHAGLGDDRRGTTSLASSSVLVSDTRPKNEHGFYIGQNVFHSKFGEGRIISFEGNAPDTKAQVSFARHGTKWLQLNIAKLTAV
jgi:DNA helicase-2/ATP-dependent DNA helicase PcrA